MFKQPERKSANWNYAIPVVVVAGCAIVTAFYFSSRDADPSAVPPRTSLSDDAGYSAASEPETPPDLFASLVESGVRQIESNRRAERSSQLSSTDEHIVDGQYDAPGFSEEDVKLLHARQQSDVEQMLSDLDAIVIESENGDGRGITVRELQSLHEQQERNLESVFEDEVVIPAGADNSAALTVADLRAFHEGQGKELGATDFGGEIVISRSVDGTGDLTGAEIVALHERERVTSQSDTGSMNDNPAPVPDVGSSYLTVDELRGLHRSQSQE